MCDSLGDIVPIKFIFRTKTNGKTEKKPYRSLIKLNKKSYSAPKLFYKIYHPEAEIKDRSKIIYIDGNFENLSYKNLKLKNPGDRSDVGSRKKATPEMIAAIKKDYNKSEFESAKNYRNQFNRKGLSMRQLSAKYGLCLSTILKIINDEY